MQRYEQAFLIDPGIFRRLGLRVPVRIEARGDVVAERVASRLSGSPRLDEDAGGFVLRVQADRAEGSACLMGTDNSEIACGRASAKAGDDADVMVAKLVQDFHEKAFAPRIDMGQTDINSLDGTNLLDTRLESYTGFDTRYRDFVINDRRYGFTVRASY